MRIAIPCWRGRVSPVFDAARNLLLVDLENGRELRRETRPITEAGPCARAAEACGLGIDLLICGAISAPLEASLSRRGLRVVGFVCGPVERVIEAFLQGGLGSAAFRMPGCKGPRHSRGGRPGRGGPHFRKRSD